MAPRVHRTSFASIAGAILPVHATNGAPDDTERHVRLHRNEIHAVLREFLGAPRTQEASTIILVRAGIDHPGAQQCQSP